MTTQAQQVLISEAKAVFEEKFSRPPSVVVVAPGRVNLIGEHIDYNDGFVLPMGIERSVVIAGGVLEASTAGQAHFYSVQLDALSSLSVNTISEARSHQWDSYMEGVIAGFLDRGIAIPAFDAVIHSDIPIGGGLSSSAAIEVATATLLEALTGHALSPQDKALLCQQAEHKFAGVPCGIMDQFSSVFAEENALLLIDCQSQEVESVRFVSEEVCVLISNSHVHHALVDGEYAARRQQCDGALVKLTHTSWRGVSMNEVDNARDALGEVGHKRARHVVSEIARTLQAAHAFRAGDWEGVGALMYASHASLRDDFEVSCAELDVLVNSAQALGVEEGVYGARMTGGGFGGCTVALVDACAVERIQCVLHEEYKKETEIDASSFVSRPARGAHLVKG